ncbi:hypothetical protein Q3G72_011852 [Acer saccharum]|nr:hypothetical protein Q3G72_011852 [Acer saccharum]
MADSEGMEKIGVSDGTYGTVGAAVVAILIPILLSVVLMGKKKGKLRGVPIEVGGEAGYAVRNGQISEMVEVPWKRATTMAALFEQSCKAHPRDRFLGTRKLINKELVTASDGRKFEKVHLGDYEWQTYGEVLDRASHFASGLVKLGHDVETRAAIFSDTWAEWLIALQSVMLAAGCAIGYGSTLTITDTSSKIKKGTKGDASALKPTLMAAVPAVLDRVREGVVKKSQLEGSWFGAWGLEKILWDVIAFKKVRAVLGVDIRFMLCGGAPLSVDSQRFINICMGAPVGQGYGLTETCAGAAFSEWDGTTVGRVGPPLPCSYIKVEAALSSANYVDSIMVHADPFHNYCVALVVPSYKVLENWAQEAGIKYQNFSELCEKTEAVSEVQQSLFKVGKAAKLDKFEIPAKIKLLPQPWTPESRLVTAALKIKREQLKAKFKDDLQKMYR